MSRCCICGNETESNAGGLLINGRTAPICNACGDVLDAAETMDRQNPRKKELLSLLQEKMKENGSSSAVIEAINEIFSEDPSEDIKEFIQTEKNDIEREKREEKEIAAITSKNHIESLCNFLSVFAVIFLVCGILLCLVVGGILASEPLTKATGWTIIIGGILGTILCFAMIMLMLNVALAIGKINGKMDVTNEKIENTNKQLGRIANMLSSAENRKQKKQ